MDGLQRRNSSRAAGPQHNNAQLIYPRTSDHPLPVVGKKQTRRGTGGDALRSLTGSITHHTSPSPMSHATKVPVSQATGPCNKTHHQVGIWSPVGVNRDRQTSGSNLKLAKEKNLVWEVGTLILLFFSYRHGCCSGYVGGDNR